ncbi:hypothetical protein PAMP_012202 [Pampus punctatissimus]
MMKLRILIFTSVMIPWILSSAVKGEYMEARKPTNLMVSDLDYETPQESNTDPRAAPNTKATIKRIDLTGNLIAEIEDGAFSKLPNLEELSLAENRLTKIPALPTKLVSFNANFNKLTTQGVKATAFKKLVRLEYLYLGNNELTAVPRLPESLHTVHLQNNKIAKITDETFCKGNTSYYLRTNLDEVRLDGNPIKLSRHPNSFICLYTLPIGQYN